MGELLHCFPVEWRRAAHTAELWTCLHNRPWVLPLTAPHPKKTEEREEGKPGQSTKDICNTVPRDKSDSKEQGFCHSSCVCMYVSVTAV